jgi:hypothetical protein
VSDDARARLYEPTKAAGIEFIEENGGDRGLRFREPRATSFRFRIVQSAISFEKRSGRIDINALLVLNEIIGPKGLAWPEICMSAI